MRLDRHRLTGMYAVFAAYTYFLLFAQFGFLHRAQAQLPDARPAMAAMGLAGLISSFVTARWLRKESRLRPALIGCALTAVASLAARNALSFTVVAAATGYFTAMLTVSLATQLRSIVGADKLGLTVGVATGLAYFVCNLPVLFEGSARTQALVPTALCAVCALLPLPRGPAEDLIGVGSNSNVTGFVVMLLALVGLDSAAFAIIQQSPELKNLMWSSPLQKMAMGSMHLVAAVLAGVMIDRGWLRGALWSAFGLFAIALPSSNGPLYAVGISFYSVALVVTPSLIVAKWPARWRSALVYGIAGWIGSAMGIGLAQRINFVPLSAIAAAGVLMLAGAWWSRRTVVVIALLVACTARAEDLSGQIAHGRRVYISEGCINCHSQFIRPGTPDVEMWGPYRPVDFTETPPLIGNRRQGPDLMNVGNRRHPLWQKLHLMNPRQISPGSKMPSYDYLFADARGDDLVAYLSSLGSTTLATRVRANLLWTLPAAADSADRGRELFQKSCSPCHGTSGAGDGPLSSVWSDPAVNLRDGPFQFVAGPDRRQALARIVKFGITGMAMPGHEYLANGEISDIVAYLESIEPHHAP